MLTTTLWAAHVVLALFFLFAGLPKIVSRVSTAGPVSTTSPARSPC